jgi:hypothetical protein
LDFENSTASGAVVVVVDDDDKRRKSFGPTGWRGGGGQCYGT